MKKSIAWLFAGFLLAAGLPPVRAVEWREDLAAAARDARESRRLLLLNFSGSDWCGWCKRLDAEVFSQPAFEAYAQSNLVAMVADFPQRTPQDPALQAQNMRLMRHFQVNTFPRLLLFSPDGELIGELGYQPGGAEAFIRAIQQARARHQMRRPGDPSGPRLPL